MNTETQEKVINVEELEWGGNTGFRDFRQAYVAAGGKLISPIRKNHKLGRNEPCHCGSGKKYKKCCG